MCMRYFCMKINDKTVGRSFGYKLKQRTGKILFNLYVEFQNMHIHVRAEKLSRIKHFVLHMNIFAVC